MSSTANGSTTVILTNHRSVREKLKPFLNLSMPSCPVKQVLLALFSRGKQKGKGEATLP